MSDNSKKFYPPSSSEIAKLLGLEPTDTAPVVEPVSTVLPPGLPTAAEENVEITVVEDVVASVEFAKQQDENIAQDQSGGFARNFFTIVTGALPYVAVFAVGLVVYYVLFADGGIRPDFGKEEISSQEQAKLDKQEAINQLKQNSSKEYLAWIAQFYFDVSDNKLLEMDRIANNKLTNFENYLLKLNPKNYDTLQNGKSDAQNILNGINPKTGQPLSDNERDIIAKYFNVDVIRQRVGGLPNEVDRQITEDPGVEGLPSTPVNLENRLNINTEVAGRLEIPLIGVNTPVIWTQDPVNFDSDLRKGIVHYPGTPYPGSVGTSYISGHSSNYAWVKADFNKVFEKLNELPEGATFKITVVGPNGKNIWLHYVIERKQEFLPDDQEQFISTADSVVALSTCWPINTTQKRLVAFGKLNRVEYE